jgi:UDP-N-acetylmuramate--alanine ligase
MPSKPLKLFFSGIGGSGMSAIASFMADKGHLIAGSDRAFEGNPSHPVYSLLKARGITIVPQDGSGIDKSLDLAVFSTAVEPDRPEAIKAKSLGIPVKTRPELLADLVKEFKTIAVSGTSGKSTSAGMLALLMKKLGLNPNFIGGGRVKEFKTETNPGNSLSGSSDSLVIEACESDGSLVDYRPLHSIILNLDLDHHLVDKTAEMFRSLIKHSPGMVIINRDDMNLVPLLRPGMVTFSVDNPSDYKAEQIEYSTFSTDFSVRSTRFHLSLPGKYNLSNALSCIAFLSRTNVPLKHIAKILPEFTGIERRFDIHLNNGRLLVIDDYAHNPHKISSLMAALKKFRERVCYIFQPHGFGPTKMMKKEYIDAFAGNLRDSDHLILLPIFYAGGSASKNISSHDLAEGIRARGRSVEVVDDRKLILNRTDPWDTYVVLGARDETLSDFAEEIAEMLSK